MIVPRFWAEAVVRERVRGRPATVRRFGWSDTSPDDAQRNADQRAREAMDRLAAGQKLRRREPKVAYNGADGVPIREEIVDRRGDAIVTRNSYGARCLNTPDVLFADVDVRTGAPPGLLIVVVVVIVAGAGVFAVQGGQWLWALPSTLLAFVVAAPLAGVLEAARQRLSGGAERMALRRVERFFALRPDWSARVYRTPAGLRVLVTHRTFEPAEPAVAHFFRALGTDPIYVRMCLHQRCFRARVSAKPWRIGIAAHIRPRPGVWPVASERLPGRQRWVEAYEHAAQGYAACRFLAAIGSGAAHPAALAVQAFHDQLCRAESDLPLA